MKRIFAVMLTIMTMVSVSTVTVFAATDTSNVTSIISGFGKPLFLLLLVICCIAIFTGAEGKRWAKGTIIAAIIAAVGIMYQEEIVDMIWGVKSASIVLPVDFVQASIRVFLRV